MDKSNATLDATDKQFLDRSGASMYIRDVLAKIVENRPDDPLQFLANYFENIGNPKDKVAQASHQLSLAHFTKPAFDSNLVSAYNILSQSKAVTPRGSAIKWQSGKLVHGVNGVIYTKLLQLLTKDMPASVRDSLHKKIRCRDHEVVIFDVFKSGVTICMILKDFLKEAETLFKSLDAKNCGKVDQNLCETLAQQLVTVNAKSSQDPTTILEVGSSLGPAQLSAVLPSMCGRTSKSQMTCEEFVRLTADAFLVTVVHLK